MPSLLNYRFMGLTLRPMAWPDNVVAFGRSARQAASALRCIADVLHLRHLTVKEDSTEIVPASTRRLRWRKVRSQYLSFEVVDEMKVLGYWLTCNGDHVRNMSTMRGALRGKLAMMDKRFASVPRMVKAKWRQLQFRGVVGFYAPFIGLGRTIMRQLAPVNNSGARKVLGVRPFYTNGSELNRVQEHYRICVQTFFCHSIVQYLGHCFRHIEIPISRLLSLPVSCSTVTARSSRAV